MRLLLTFLLVLLFTVDVSAQCTSPDGDFSFVANPPLPAGGYAPGTVVNMCFTLEGFFNENANWVHSILPTFGPGYDVSTLVPGAPPAACIATGSWAWYDTWDRCQGGTSSGPFGPGFGFDSGGGISCGGTANDGDPGNNFGDGPAFCNRTFCWDITTQPGGACPNEAFIVRVEVNPDSESGSYGVSACIDDEPLCWPIVENPMASINMPCPGENFVMTGSFDSDGCGIQTEWLLNGVVVGTGLTHTTMVEGTYTLQINASGCDPVEAMVTATYQNATPTLTPNGVVDYCFGETVTLTASGGTTYEYNGPNGQTSTQNPFSFTADAAADGTWTVTVFNGASSACSQTLDVTIIVAPELFPVAVVNPDPVCEGETVTLTGSGAGPGGAYEWTLPNGGQVTQNPFVYTTESSGTNSGILTVFDASGNCSEDIPYDFFVNPLPDATATALPDMSCENDPVELFATGGGTYMWSTGQSGSPIIVMPSPPQETYMVTVTSADGCVDVADVTVVVQRFLDAPVIDCEQIDPTELLFTWPAVSGADYYQIFISINGGAFVEVESQFFGTSYELDDLDALTMVDIRIVPYTNANPACPGAEGEQSCSTPDCNPATIFLEDGMTGPYCYDATSNDPIVLAAEVNAVDNGRLFWSGPGIFFESNPADFFPPGPGNYDLTVHFELTDGSCPFEETFTIIVDAAASATIDASETQACADETIIVELDGNVNNAATYLWDFGGATVDSGSGDAGPYTLSFPAAGMYTVSLMTTLGECTDMDEVIITVGNPIIAPTVICQSTTQDEIIFSWNTVPGATGYTVNLISGPAGTVVGNTYVVSGLTFGQEVEISVTAEGTALCDAATSAVQLCEAQSCPDIILTVTTPPETFCLTNQNDPIVLEFTTDAPSNPTDTIWSGPGVVGNTFDPDVAGVGTHTVTVSVTDDNCPFNANVEFIVLALPTSTFDLPTEACVDGEITITYTGDADPNNSVFMWDFAGGTIVSGAGAGPYVISWPSPGTFDVSLAVNDGNCASMESQNPITVIESLALPIVNCVNPGLDEVTFEWVVDPNATGYTVTVVSGPAGVQMGNQYRVTGLAENDIVTIEVVALNSGICGDSEPREISCQAISCPDIMVDIDNLPSDFCDDNGAVTVELFATITGSVVPGNLTWTGPSVIGSTFFVDEANVGENEIIAIYTEGGCTYMDTVIFTIFAVPTPTFSIDLAEVCVGQEAVLNFTGAMLAAGSSFSWDFDGGNAIPGAGEGPHTVTWDTPGTKTVSLTVTENGCTSLPFTQDIDIIAPLPAPALACGAGTVDSVSFSWTPIPGALGYVVTLDGGAPDTITATDIGIGQLTEGQIVVAVVYALGAAPCNDGPPATESCPAETCPGIALVIDESNNQLCLGVVDQFQVLEIAQNSGSGTGTYTWSGPGVSNDTFYYSGLAVGDHEVIVAYQEGLCSYGDTATFTIFPQPIASFDISADSVCLLDNDTITYVGIAGAGDTYNWDFDGGTADPGTGPGPHSVFWNTPGLKEVSLSVTEGVCTSPIFTDTIIVVDTLASPILSCGDSVGLNFLTVEWDLIPGAIAYEISVDGILTDTVTTNRYVLENLTPGHTCDITVRPIGTTGISCGGNPSTITCSCLPCDDIGFDFSANPNNICLDVTTDQSFTLVAAVFGGSGFGDFVWNGNGVVGDVFDPAIAGVGDHIIDVTFTDFEGPCFGADQFTITVLEIPVADFTISADPVCMNEEFTVTFTGTAPTGSVFSWNIGGNLVTGEGPHLVSFPTAGIFDIDLTVDVAGCSNTATTQTVEVIQELAAPVVMCTGADLNSVSVEWNDVTPNGGYLVSVDNGTPVIVMGTTFTVDNLLPDTEVDISVVVISTGPCPNSEPGTTSCTSEACPNLTADFSANTTSFCLDATTDQSFQLTATVGSGANQVFVWSGPGVTGDVFDPAIAGVGIHTITLNYSEEGPCTFTDDFMIQVFEVPVATFDISTDLACTNEDVTITFTGTASPGSTFNWTVSNGAVLVGPGPHIVSSTTATMINVELTVASSGCSDTAPAQVITVVAPLEAVVLTCSEQQLEQVTFSWPAVTGATQYVVEIIGVGLDTVSTTSYTIDGLTPEESTSITVRAVGAAPCGDGPADTESCSALPCPDITINVVVAAQDFCLTNDVERVLIDLTTVGGDMTGTFTVIGDGVIQEGSDFFFDPTVAGVGSHVINIDYAETAGCSATNSITMNVFGVPSSDFTVSDDDICSTETTTISYTGTAATDWDFDGGTIISQTDETYVISWLTAGTYTVSLTVTENNCVSSSSATVVVTEPLVTPVPFCEGTTITSVTFSWAAVVGATGYSVSIDNGTPVIITETTFTVSDLQDEQTVTLTLIALGDEPCGNSETIEVSCTTDPCVDYTLVPSIAQSNFCTADEDLPVTLELAVNGNGPADGTITWTGSGVISQGADFLFDPMAVAPGTYTLTATYIESICTTTTSLTVNVFATPEVIFNNFTSVICETGETTIVLTNGDNAAFADLTWNLEGGLLTSLPNNTFTISWPTPGTFNVTLDLERDGCTNSYSFPITVEPQANAGSQITELSVCSGSGEVIELSQLLGGADEGGIWSPGPGSPAVISAATGQLPTNNLAAGAYTYLYTIEGNACETSVAEVNIEVQPAPVALTGIAQTLTCDMGMVSLNGSASTGAGNLQYFWTGPNGQQGLIMDPESAMIDVSLPGTYVLTVTSELGCSASESVEVIADTEVPIPQIELSNISCFSADDGAVLVSSVQGGRAPYTYSLDGATPVGSGFFTGLQPAEYSLRVSDANGCFSDLFLDVSEPEQLSISINIPNDDPNYDLGERVTLSASISGGNIIDTVIWEPDTLNQRGEGNTITFIASETQQVMVTVVDELGCRATDLTTIFVRREDPVYIPSGISPNGDNVNDILFIGADPERVLIVESFLIFNRWGETVYQNYDFLPNEPAQGWDGKHRGETLNPEVFVYVAVIEMVDGEKVVYKGDITLLR